jgi:hypothetical protein
MMLIRRGDSRPLIPGLLVVILLLTVAATASGQTPGEAAVAPLMALAAQAPPTTPAPQGPAFWELIGGFEADTHGTGYGFFGPSYVHPITPGLAWTARVFANYLYYQFGEGIGETKVRSPGVSTAVGLRFGDQNLFGLTTGAEGFFGVSAGPEVKWRREEFHRADGTLVRKDTTEVGASFGAELYTNPTSHNVVQAVFAYGMADSYAYGQLSFKEQVSNLTGQGPNTVFVGVEGIAQGNKDITSIQGGGLVQLTHVPWATSVTLRAGYKHSSFVSGPDKTGPYFGIGLYKRF